MIFYIEPYIYEQPSIYDSRNIHFIKLAETLQTSMVPTIVGITLLCKHTFHLQSSINYRVLKL